MQEFVFLFSPSVILTLLNCFEIYLYNLKDVRPLNKNFHRESHVRNG